MEKLRLTSLRLSKEELLEKAQLKNIFGGAFGEGSCTVTCNDGTQHEVSDCDRSTAEKACGVGEASQCAGLSSQCGSDA